MSSRPCVGHGPDSGADPVSPDFRASPFFAGTLAHRFPGGWLFGFWIQTWIFWTSYIHWLPENQALWPLCGVYLRSRRKSIPTPPQSASDQTTKQFHLIIKLTRISKADSRNPRSPHQWRAARPLVALRALWPPWQTNDPCLLRTELYICTCT